MPKEVNDAQVGKEE
jgi:hypothetical protein